ncbi:MAG: hypothetical protein DI537_55135, partial [Stutzerimonas stutzeri]
LSGKPFDIPYAATAQPMRDLTMRLLSHLDIDRVRRMLTIPTKMLRGYGTNEEHEKLGVTRKDITEIPERALLV